MNWLEYVNITSVINSGGWLECRGAKVLDHLPGFEAKYGGTYNGYPGDWDCHGNEMGNDGPFNFAYLVTHAHPSHRHRPPSEHSANDTTGGHENDRDDIGKPIAYFPAGKTTWKGEPPKIAPKEDYEMDSLLKIPGMRDNIIKALKIALITKASDDSDMLHMTMEYFHWNYDTIDKYKIAIPVELFVNVSPNPTGDKAKLSYSLLEDSRVNITVTNMLGQDFNFIVAHYEELQTSGKHQVTLNSENLNPGIYLVSVIINGKSTTKKLIKI